tara:strand:+ start:160 stop:555 length:396 start_codon:yes stop_codon:yes gene_type:complete
MATVIPPDVTVHKRDCQYIFVYQELSRPSLFHVHIAHVNFDNPGSDQHRQITLYYQYVEQTRVVKDQGQHQAKSLLLTQALVYGSQTINHMDPVAQWVYYNVVINGQGRKWRGVPQNEAAVLINPGLRLRN